MHEDKPMSTKQTSSIVNRQAYEPYGKFDSQLKE